MNVKLLFLFILSLMVTTVVGQQFEGVATYKTSRKMDIKMDSTQINNDMQAQLMEQLRKQFQKEYNLSFTKDASFYKEVEKLDAPSVASASGISIVVSGGSDVLYRNTTENTYVNQTEISGKQFLIEDKTQKPEWNLEKETKFIGDYRCFKASYKREVEDQSFDSMSDSLVTIKKTVITNAWYTLDIPVAHGPSEYWGLPGLILEIEEGDLSILCSKIVMNPAKGVAIDIPTKGKKVTQDQFDVIQEEKNKEMIERFQSDGRRDGNNSSFSIKIGG